MQRDPENIKTIESLMIAQLKIEKWDDLISSCRKTLQIDNTNTKAIGLLAKALKENKKFKDLENFLLKIKKKADILEKKYSNESKNNGDFPDEEVLANIKNLKEKIKKKISNIKRIKLINNFSLSDDVRDVPYLTNNQTKNLDIDLNEMQNDNLNNNETIDEPNIYLDILKSDENNLVAIYNLGVIYFKRNDFENALNYLNMLTNSNFQNLNLVFMRIGDIYYSHYKDMDKALEYYLNSISKNKIDICYIKIGRCYASLNDEEKEIEYYKKALEFNPDQEWANFFMGTFFSKKSNREESLSFLKKAYLLDKSNVHFIVSYCDELSKSKIKKDLDNAIEILKIAKISLPMKIDIHIKLSEIYEITNELNKAIEVLEEANRVGEFYNNTDKLFKLGVIYEKVNSYNKAVSIFKKVLFQKKEHTPSLCHLGFILASTKEYKRSLKYFKYAIKVNPDLAYAYYGIGKIFQQIGNYEDALENYANCLEKNPNSYK